MPGWGLNRIRSGRSAGLRRYRRSPIFPGDEAFKLYETFGLPRDFIEDACRDQGIDFDAAGFDRAMEEQRAVRRLPGKVARKASASPLYQSLPRTEFEGYPKNALHRR